MTAKECNQVYILDAFFSTLRLENFILIHNVGHIPNFIYLRSCVFEIPSDKHMNMDSQSFDRFCSKEFVRTLGIYTLKILIRFRYLFCSKFLNQEFHINDPNEKRTKEEYKGQT